MEHHLPGPFWGNVVIVAVAGAITLACFAAMVRMLIRPAESDPGHPKHGVLSDDR
jgi:hypothetical protein